MEKLEVTKIGRRSAQEKSRLLTAYRESGQTQKDFCQANAISVPTLASWMKRARQSRSGGSGSGLVEVPGFAGLNGAVVIELRSGLNVRVPFGAPVAWLGELMGALRCGG